MTRQSIKDQIVGRMYVLLMLFTVALLLIVGQLAWIHFVEGRELRAQGLRQARSQTVLAAKRGTIVDHAGRALAVNAPRYDLALDPTSPGFEEARAEFASLLSRVTGWSERSIQRRIDARSSPRYVRMGEVSTEQRQVLDTLGVPGLIVLESFTRKYNYGTTAAHVLGHVDRDGVGQAGLELEYDEFLQGTPGRRMLLRDRRGYRRVDAAGVVVEPKDGQTLVLTIDLIRQTILEEELERGVREARARRGSAIAVNPRTGAILAMASVPSFDPNNPSGAPRDAWRNSAITDRLEPGSSFKLVGTSAAIDLGVTSMDRIIDTGDGTLNIFGQVMRDVHAQGEIPLRDVITFSSNVGMAKTAQMLERADLYRYARNFGFGQKTWIDLPGEVPGLLKKTNRWSKTTLTSLAIGYEVDVTPLQMVMAYAALGNGGLLLQPYVVAERRDITGKVLWRAADDPARQDSVRRVMDEATARALLPAFADVVERGTAKRAQVQGLSVAGKTGTARKVVRGRYGGGYRANFIGFYPADSPQVAMVIVMDEPRASIYGGVVAAPVFKRVAERWIGTLPAVAEQLIPGDPHLDIIPPVPPAQVRMTSLAGPIPTQDTTVGIMPDLVGMSARAARHAMVQRGLRVRLQGHGRVISQDPAAGDSCRQEVVLTLE